MKITTVLTTKGARSLKHKQPVSYYSPCQGLELKCHQDEADEFERDTEIKLGADVLRGNEWTHLVNWANENAGLRVDGAYSEQSLHQVPQRFVWVVGAIRETYPDIPAEVENEPGLVLWDRQERAVAMRVSPAYAQAMCLELNDCAAWSPFTTLEQWWNSLSNEDLASENLPVNKPSTKGPQ